MIEIYAVNLLRGLDTSTFDQLLSLLPLAKQKKINRFYNFEDAQRGLLGDLLIRYIIRKKGIAKHHEIQFETNDYGKPYLLNAPNFEFNLSHSEDWVVCAIDTTPIGIDVEIIKSIDLESANQFFTTKERNYVFSLPDLQVFRFFDIWTLKESYIKTVGLGLSLPLDSFSIVLNTTNQTIEVETEDSDETTFRFKQYSIDPNYKLAICAHHNHFPSEVIKIDLAELVENIIVSFKKDFDRIG
jgi:4'-phosphopantetheinyl transferase